MDAHHHLWDVEVRGYPFLARRGLEPLRRTFGVGDFAAAAPGVTAGVVVQAVSSEAETVDLLAAAAGPGPVRAVVGWVDLTAPDVADRIAARRAGPGGSALAGVRHQVEDEPDPSWLLRPDVLRGLAAVAEAGLVYDLLVKPPQYDAAIEAARRLPELRIVLDHLGKPDVAGGMWRPWSGWIATLAALPNVAAKLSGLVTEDDWTGWTRERLVPYGRHALDAFGPDRVMYGSDWPVCTLAADHATVTTLAEATLTAFAPDDPTTHNTVFTTTAQTWYHLPP
ncbi:MAG: amidohydrolase family protein [Streptosporangiales bacterium]|nr:amidohydrolase family protein [Streptosporangiales bacterium]